MQPEQTHVQPAVTSAHAATSAQLHLTVIEIALLTTFSDLEASV